jgi:MinD-like ATPase involved in chromosome partitioning or flagellar assembly
VSAAVLTAVSHRLEAELVAGLDATPRVRVVRRCADLAELLSAAATGVADVAVVSPDLRGLDREALRQLAGQGVRVAALVPAEDEPGERRLRQMGVVTVLRPGEPADEVADRLAALAEGTTTGGGTGADRESPSAPHAGGSRWAPGSPGSPGAPGGDPWPDDAPGGRPAGGTAAGPGVEAGSGAPPPGRGVLPGDSARLPVRAPVTAVWGPTGAPGRTTVAVTLAARLAASGVRTLLVDLDTWGASVAQVLALVDEAPGVAAAARASEHGTLDLPGLARLSPEVVPGLRVLTGLPRPERWPELRAAAVEDVLDLGRRLVDHVVVDCGFAIEDDEELSYDTAAPRRNATTLVALERATSLVVVGSADPVGLQRLVRAVQDVAVVPSPPPTVVVNKVRASAAGPHPQRAIAEVLGRFAGMAELHYVPWAPAECDAALLAGRSLVEHAPTAAVTEAISALAGVVRPGLARPRATARAARLPLRPFARGARATS